MQVPESNEVRTEGRSDYFPQGDIQSQIRQKQKQECFATMTDHCCTHRLLEIVTGTTRLDTLAAEPSQKATRRSPNMVIGQRRYTHVPILQRMRGRRARVEKCRLVVTHRPLVRLQQPTFEINDRQLE